MCTKRGKLLLLIFKRYLSFKQYPKSEISNVAKQWQAWVAAACGVDSRDGGLNNLSTKNILPHQGLKMMMMMSATVDDGLDVSLPH